MWLFELAPRFQKEVFLTGRALYETVLAIAERVNRKVQILRLHFQATQQIEYSRRIARDVGRLLADQFEPSWAGLRSRPLVPLGELRSAVSQAAVRVKQSRGMLLQIEIHLRELKAEAAHEDLLAIQRDLSLRDAALERVVVMRGAAVTGQPLGQFQWPPPTRIAAVWRGSFFLPLTDALQLRAGDVALLIGVRNGLEEVVPYFRRPTALKSATREPA